MIHLKKQVASFLLARLNPELSRATCCISLRYSCRHFSSSIILSYEVSASSATRGKLQVNINCPAVLTKGFANKGCADEGALISSSKYSNSNFSQVHPSWRLNSNLFTSALCWVVKIRRLLDTPRSSFFQAALQFFRSIQGCPRGASGVSQRFFSRGSFAMPWCRFADVHFPHWSTGGATLRFHPLRFEVIFRSRSCRGFHLDQYLSQLSDPRVALVGCSFSSR